MSASRRSASHAVYVISVAAELAGMHPQTLRIYERKGLVDPARTAGGNRRYSDDDLSRLRRIAELTELGLNLAGVKMVLDLERQVAHLRDELAHTRQQAADAVAEAERRNKRELVPLHQAVAIFGQMPSIFDRDDR